MLLAALSTGHKVGLGLVGLAFVLFALAGYNAGPTAVEKIGRAPSLETLRYTKNVEARAASLAAC